MVRRVHKYANGGQVVDFLKSLPHQSVEEMRRQRDVGIAQTKAKFKAQQAAAAAPVPRPAPAPVPVPRPVPAPVPAPAPAAATVDRSGNRLGARPQVGPADAATRRKMLDEALRGK